jgi:hypothetical protein
VPHWARFEWALTYLVVSSQSHIRTLTVCRASRLRLHILNRKKRTLRHGHPVVPIFASRTCHQAYSARPIVLRFSNVWGVMTKKSLPVLRRRTVLRYTNFATVDWAVSISRITQLSINIHPLQRAKTAGRPIRRRDLQRQHKRKPFDSMRPQQGNDGREGSLHGHA